ncbi:MAG: ABC transporter substrate-binding protein [Chloroflexota bacterium]
MKKSGISYSVTRRRFLRDATLTSLGIVAAACTPGATPGTSPSGGTSAKGGQFNGAWPYDLPPKGHFNYFAASGIILQGAIYLDLFLPPLATYRWADAKWEYWLAESSSLNGNVFEVKLRPNIKWSDGTAFTSKDVVTTFQIGRMDSFKIWQYIDKVEAAGDLTVRFNYLKPSSVGERNILRVSIKPDSVYGAIAKKAADLYASGKTTSAPELVALRAEKDGLRPEPYSVGPYKIDKASITEAQLTMVRNDGGLFADKVNFDKVVIYQGETAQVTPLVLAGDVDYATHGFPLATDRAFGDAGIRVIRGPGYTGPAIVFHWEKAAAFQDKRLRQAVAYAINKDESAKVTYGESAKPQKFMAGFSDNLVPLWVSAADQAKLNSYAFDLGKAAALMTAAGYAKGSDGIYAKDGKKLEFELYFPSDFADWSSAADHAQKSLNTFGIKIVPRGAIRSQQLPDVNGGNFQIAIMGWGIGNPHPQQSYEQTLQAFNTIPAGGGMKYPLKQGDVDFEALINQMGEGFDTNKQKDPVTKAALAFNDLLPVVQLWERYGNNPVNDKKRVKGWKPDSDPIYKNPWSTDAFTTFMIMDGTLGKI